MLHLLAQAVSDGPTPVEHVPAVDPRQVVAALLILGAITLAIWAMTKARTPLKGEDR